MIIQFKVRNFLSFQTETVFSMVPGQGRLMKNHKTDAVNGISVLKTATVFGANAGGKSNLVKAIAFAKYMVLHGTRPDSLIDYHPFLLSEETKNGDSEIEFELQANGKNYIYGFIFNNEEIKEEWLCERTRRGETAIFERKPAGFNMEYLLKRNKNEKAKQYLQFFAQSTPKNQLFLHEVFARNITANVEHIDEMLDVIEWFLDTLKIIFPDTPYKQAVMSRADIDNELKRIYAELLRYFDTGIDDIEFFPADIEKLGIPQSLLHDIKADLLKSKGKDAYGTLSLGGDLYIITAADNVVSAKKLLTIHKMTDGGKGDIALFSLSDESDGTKRLFDYIPLIIDLFKGAKVFVVDEMERSLHPNLIYGIFKLFLDYCDDVNSQLIVTTHESSLMTQNLLRKDEIWFMNKTSQGSSELKPLEEYKVRFDKELRSSYLKGVFGGVPDFAGRDKLSALIGANMNKEEEHAEKAE